MPLFILTQWRWLVPTAAAVALAVMLLVAKLTIAGLHTQIATQNAKASELLALITAANAAKDAVQAEFTRSLDEANAHETAAIAARSDSLERGYANQLRKLAASRTCGTSAGTTETAYPGVVATSTDIRDDELQRRITDVAGRVKRIADAGDTNAALIRDVCIPWAASVGR